MGKLFHHQNIILKKLKLTKTEAKDQVFFNNWLEECFPLTDMEEEEFGDPYIYLFDDTTDELIQQDDDGGCDCGTYEECGESGNCWDSAITRTLNPGTYRLEVDVYSQETTGYYNVTIQENQETEEP